MTSENIDIEKILVEFRDEVESLVGNKEKFFDNNIRRKLYSKIELFRLELEENNLTNLSNGPKVIEELNKLVALIPLIPLRRPQNLLTWIETTIRFIGVSNSFIFAGTFLSIPILIIRIFDILLQVDPFNYLSEKIKKVIIFSFLYQSGIELEVQGLKNEFFDAKCSLMTFTHSSNLDGFFVAGTCPIRQLAFGKKELFVVPFFSWLSLAIGGVPVDRSNRDRAIKALQRSVESAKKEKITIAVAPEGTRSTSGQLLQFKKGPFYIWEELKAPLIPFIIFGAFDLYPVGSWVNNPGKVIVRYLPPIVANESSTRDGMLRKLRKDLLISIADCPLDVGREVSYSFRILSTLSNIAIVATNVSLAYFAYKKTIIDWNMPPLTVLSWFSISTISTTAFLYIYYVYLVDLFGSKKDTTKKAH